jgi:hypothetical protein
VSLFHEQRYVELEGRVRLFIGQHPDSGFAWKLLGAALGVQGKDALLALRKAAEILPDDADVHNNLGNALHDLGWLEEAVASYRRAVEIKPDFASAQYNLGIVFSTLGQIDSALESYRLALEIKPDYADAHSNYAYLLLALGEFERGWREYEWRYARRFVGERVGSALPDASFMLPFGSQRKRILLCHEQGIGDELFFLRFAHQLREQAQWVGYWSTDKISSLVERSGCVDEVMSGFDQASRVDSIIPVSDLPLLLGCSSTEVIPEPLRLFPNGQHVERIRRHLGKLDLLGKCLLGVTWRAGLTPVPGQPKTLFKQINVDLLADAIKGWDGAILVLQREPEQEEIKQLRAKVSCPVHDFSDYNDNLEAMLALLDTLDDYVGVSNTNMHLMAGLGKTARVLLPAPAEWRWMASGDRSPWFPKFALYRQAVSGDWAQALAALSRDLSARQ